MTGSPSKLLAPLQNALGAPLASLLAAATPGPGERERLPPRSGLPADERSILAEQYGDATLLDCVPIPNMEWWWHAIDFEQQEGNVTAPDGHAYVTTRYSLISNVHVFALPVKGLATQGTILVRRLRVFWGGNGGERIVATHWEAHAEGELDPSGNCRFTAKDWDLFRIDPQLPSWQRDHARAHARIPESSSGLDQSLPQQGAGYSIHVEAEDLVLDLLLADNAVVEYGDRGWYDNNPAGYLPYWASYRSRFSSVLYLDLQLREHGRQHPLGAAPSRVVLAGSTATGAVCRFDHQSIHWSLQDVTEPWSPALALEVASARPKWNWYHTQIKWENARSADGGNAQKDKETDQGKINFLIYECRNENTGAMLRREAVAVMLDGEYANIPVRLQVVEFSRSGVVGELAAPLRPVVRLRLDRPSEPRPVALTEKDVSELLLRIERLAMRTLRVEEVRQIRALLARSFDHEYSLCVELAEWLQISHDTLLGELEPLLRGRGDGTQAALQELQRRLAPSTTLSPQAQSRVEIELSFDYPEEEDWSVFYDLAGRLSYKVFEFPCQVRLRSRVSSGLTGGGSGTLEVFDYVKSLTLRSSDGRRSEALRSQGRGSRAGR